MMDIVQNKLMDKGFSYYHRIDESLPTRNYLLLFILWPFLALMTAIANYNTKEAKKVVYFFLIYYGLTFVIGEISYNGPDAQRSALNLFQIAKLPFSDFFKIVGGLYTVDTSVDIVGPLISFIVSRFTTSHGLLFAAYASVFGIFYLGSINQLYDRYKENRGWNALIHLLFFMMIIPFTEINGFRFYTAAWIYFYGAYHVVLNRNSKFLLVALASALVHFSFLTANAVLIIYYIAGNRNFIYLPLVILSFALPDLLKPVFQVISMKFGGAIQARFEGYSSEGYIFGLKESLSTTSWFVGLNAKLIFYYLLAALAFIKFRFWSRMTDRPEKNLFSFLLLFLAFVNFGQNIPSFGSRFQTVFFLFATLYLFNHYVKQSGNKINLLTLAGLFPMVLYCAVVFRIGSESINAWIFAPGLGVPLAFPALSVAEFFFH